MWCVLIDTWWNVNKTAESIMQKVDNSFNRYMVECEYAFTIASAASGTSFNRYMVECEWSV